MRTISGTGTPVGASTQEYPSCVTWISSPRRKCRRARESATVSTNALESDQGGNLPRSSFRHNDNPIANDQRRMHHEPRADAALGWRPTPEPSRSSARRGPSVDDEIVTGDKRGA